MISAPPVLCGLYHDDTRSPIIHNHEGSHGVDAGWIGSTRPCPAPCTWGSTDILQVLTIYYHPIAEPVPTHLTISIVSSASSPEQPSREERGTAHNPCSTCLTRVTTSVVCNTLMLRERRQWTLCGDKFLTRKRSVTVDPQRRYERPFLFLSRFQIEYLGGTAKDIFIHE